MLLTILTHYEVDSSFFCCSFRAYPNSSVALEATETTAVHHSQLKRRKKRRRTYLFHYLPRG